MRQLRGLTTDVCGKYCRLFALYMDRSFTPKQLILLFDISNVADQQVERLFTTEFGAKNVTWSPGSMLPQLPIKR